MVLDFVSATHEQKTYIEGTLDFSGNKQVTFGLTEPSHGSDATWHMETKAVHETRDGVSDWVINGMKRWTSQVMRVPTANCSVFARTSGQAGRCQRHHRRFSFPLDSLGSVTILYIPVDLQHALRSSESELTNVWVPNSAILGTTKAMA